MKPLMNTHICGDCRDKNCPDAGNEKYDGMLGPTIACYKYKPHFLSFEWFVRWSLLLGLSAGALYMIYVII